MNDAADAILAVVRAVPPGKVTTYGAVAERAGWPGRARLVGHVLGKLPKASGVPWHRVVAAGGRIAVPAGSPSRARQLRLLRKEGVRVVDGRVDVDRDGWGAAPGDLDRLLWRIGDEN